jgi:hypothetical protein
MSARRAIYTDALSMAVAMKVDCDLQLTLMASSRHLFRDLVEATAQVTIAAQEIQVRFQKRAHNPLLPAAGFDKTNLPIPWIDGKRLRPVFGMGRQPRAAAKLSTLPRYHAAGPEMAELKAGLLPPRPPGTDSSRTTAPRDRQNDVWGGHALMWSSS